jgi:AcrR family transcriptional regulator
MPNSVIPKRRGRPPSGGREAILAATLELLHERGIAGLTSRLIAERAGVSEGSIFYHYRDRPGLLQAAFEYGIQPLRDLAFGGLEGADHEDVLARVARNIERFLDRLLPLLNAALSDNELRDALAAYMTANDVGPHRGVRLVAEYLKDEQAAGRVSPELDPQATALMLVGGCFLRASQRQMLGRNRELPSLERLVAALDATL